MEQELNTGAMVRAKHMSRHMSDSYNSRRKRRSSGHFGLIGDEQLNEVTTRQGLEADPEEEEDYDEPEEIWWISFLVSHPCLVHAVIGSFSLFTIWLSARHTEVTRIALESLVPDSNKRGDDWRAMQDMSQAKVYYLTEPQTYADPYVFQQMFFCMTPEAIQADIDDDELGVPWIFTPSRVKTILDFEDKILKHPAWPDLKYYPAGVGGDVEYHGDLAHDESLVSIPQVIKGIFGDQADWDLEAMDKDAFQMFVQLALDMSDKAPALFDPSILEKVLSEKKNKEMLTANCYRSIFWGSLPYPTTVTEKEVNGTVVPELTEKTSIYENAWDRQAEQHNKACVKPFRFIYEDYDVADNGESVINGMRFRSYSGSIWLKFNEEYMLKTIGKAFGICVCMIIVYTTYDIGSAFLSMMALWEVIVTVPLSWFLYRIVFNIPQLGGLNLSIVFILFSVGVYYYPAYVFVDHWMQSKHLVKDHMSWKRRMAAAWEESATAAGVAQSTTFVCFLSAGIANIMWFRSFGLWAGIAIAVNYLLGITLYPCSIIIWETYIRGTEMKFRNFLKNLGLGVLSFEVADAYHARYLKRKTGSFTESSFLQQNMDVKMIDVGYGPQTYEQLKKDYRPAGRFMGIAWPGYVWKARYLVMLVVFGWIGFCVYGVTQLKPLEEAEAYHGEDSFFYKSQHQGNAFTKGFSDLNQVHLVYGIEGIKADSRNRWDSFDYGKPEYVENFDISSVPAQEYLEYVCNSTRDADHLPNGERLVFEVDKMENVICWLEEFKDYLANVHNESYPVQGVSQNELSRYLYDFYYHSEYGLDAMEGAVLQISKEGEHGAISEWEDSDTKYSLTMLRFNVRSQYIFWSSQTDCDRDMANWDLHEKHLNAYCRENVDGDGPSTGLCSMIQVSVRWAISESNRLFLKDMVYSVTVGLGLMFIILMIVLQNWIMATLCVINVGLIVVSCLGVMYLKGWTLGIIECCVAVEVLGFSVDYCVHLGHGYLMSPIATDRAGRVRYTLLTTGHAILSAAFISFVATVPLLIGKYAMFGKMGIMILCTIGFSVFFSLTFYTLTLLAFAPENNNTGRVPVQRWIWRFLCCSGCRPCRSRGPKVGQGNPQFPPV